MAVKEEAVRIKGVPRVVAKTKGADWCTVNPETSSVKFEFVPWKHPSGDNKKALCQEYRKKSMKILPPSSLLK